MTEEQKENKGQEPLEVPVNDHEAISYKQEEEMQDETVLCPSEISLFTAWKRWKDFKGRSCRKEYWFFLLSLLLLCLCMALFSPLMMLITNSVWGLLIGIPFCLAGVAILLAFIYLQFPLTVRRLHDIGLSGYWYFLIIFVTIALQLWNLLDTDAALAVTIIAGIWSFVQLVVLGFIDSQSGDNKYGANPKGVSGESRNMLQKIKSWPLPRVIGCTVGVVLLGGALFGISFRALAWFEAKAPQMEFELGCYYYKEHDKVEAIKCWRKAAELGHSEAQILLGYCYYHGYGVDEDAAETEKWWRKAAEQNHSEAQFLLGCCYFAGYGIARDVGEAEKWWSKAAEQNHAYAEETLKELPQKQHLSMQKQEQWALDLLWFSALERFERGKSIWFPPDKSPYD